MIGYTIRYPNDKVANISGWRSVCASIYTTADAAPLPSAIIVSRAQYKDLSKYFAQCFYQDRYGRYKDKVYGIEVKVAS